jgi:hypothetical protein
VSWLRVDDGFGEHEKIIDLSDRAFRLHVIALCYCARNLTDGLLRERQLATVCAITKATVRHLDELVTAGLWEPEGDSYRINDYLEYNPTKKKVKERRQARSDAGKRGSDARWNGKAHGKSDGKTHDKTHGKSDIPMSMPRPVPSRKSTNAFELLGPRAAIARQLGDVA